MKYNLFTLKRVNLALKHIKLIYLKLYVYCI